MYAITSKKEQNINCELFKAYEKSKCPGIHISCRSKKKIFGTFEKMSAGQMQITSSFHEFQLILTFQMKENF